MQHVELIERLVDLTDPSANLFLNMSADEALDRVASGDPERVREIDGQFAIVVRMNADASADIHLEDAEPVDWTEKWRDRVRAQ